MDFNINELASSVEGKIVGNSDYFFNKGFIGRFTLLNDATKGDIVIRHWINGKGIEIAASKDVACLITQNPKEDAVEKAEELNFPLIIVDRIEVANAFALKWTINKYSPNSENIIITGTNGKSTTSHLIYHILKENGYNVFTNTDAESEFNTLIDPMVSKLISDEVIENGPLDYLVIEVSEVQGWLGNLMKGHAYLMSEAIHPKVGVITNIAMDHIGLVNSIEEVFSEIHQVPEAIDETVVLNHDDDLLKKIANDLTDENIVFCSMKDKQDVFYDSSKKGIICRDELLLKDEDLPFRSSHFIQNILSAIGCCISLEISKEGIVKGVKSYKSLNRRFSILNKNPLIIDDFAHNPDGIKATISESVKLVPENHKLFVVCSIRGSRGVDINRYNVEALVESYNENMDIVLSSSVDVVNSLNFVEDDERDVFFDVLNKNNVPFIHFDNLFDALKDTYNNADKKDVILLIGAQGMDPAEGLLKNIL